MHDKGTVLYGCANGQSARHQMIDDLVQEKSDEAKYGDTVERPESYAAE